MKAPICKTFLGTFLILLTQTIMTSTQIILLNSIVVSSVVIMNTKRDYLLDEDFETKAMALINFVGNEVYYTIWPPAEQQLQQPFSSTLLTNRKKNRVKVKLPTNFVANLSH